MSTRFYPLSVTDVKTETADTVSIAFSVPAGLSQDFNYKAGQYLTFKMALGGQEVRRSYSICTAPSEKELRVAVKRIENGAFSQFATTGLKVGDRIEAMAPMGNFVINPDPASARNHVFFAAGSGITPVLSMVRTLLETEKSSTVYLFYSNRTAADTIFKAKLDELAANYPSFKLVYLLTRQDSGNPITNGRIDALKCEALYNHYLAGVKIDGVYACGPENMIMTVKDFFTSKGVEKSKIHFELFTASAAAAETSTLNMANVDAKMTVIMDDEEFKFQLSTAGKSILQAAQDAGADVPFSCKGGVCCTCKAKVLEGSVKMDLNYSLEPDEVEAGYILTCQAHPTSEKVVVSYDEY
jgi:ring-1,2-phenylacetyl-CoA epoxidase subunit PaaE